MNRLKIVILLLSLVAVGILSYQTGFRHGQTDILERF